MLRSRTIRSLGAASFLGAGLMIGIARALSAMPAEIVGPPKVVTGDTLEVQGHRVRLFGIDAPEPAQICILSDRAYDCGRIAATALMDLTAGTVVRCVPKQQAEDTLIATCYAAGYDLSEGMTYTGWALAHPSEGRRYKGLEEGARRAHRGLWMGEFVTPWEWRQGKRLAGTR